MWEVRVLLVAVAVAFTATAVFKLASSRIVNQMRMKRAVIRGGGTLQAVSVDIPNEIIFCILMYLPVKSLLRFKTVSKSWNALITNPYFVREHHSKQPSSKLFLKRQEKVEETHGTSVIPMPLSFDTKLFAHPNVYQPVKPYLSGEYLIMGPCFGVHCFGMCSQEERSVKIELCNIATGETKVCPYLNVVVDGVFSCALGFGCIHNDITSVPEFKVVALIKYALNCSTHVYSSATNSWKSVQSCQSLAYGQGIEVNGVIHWQAKSLNTKSNDNKFILTFDLQKEVFGKMELPQVAVAYSALLTKQDDQHLSLIAVTSDHLVDIWVMHVQWSWVRQAVIEKLTVSTSSSVRGLPWKADSVEVDGFVMAIGDNRYKFRAISSTCWGISSNMAAIGDSFSLNPHGFMVKLFVQFYNDECEVTNAISDIYGSPILDTWILFQNATHVLYFLHIK